MRIVISRQINRVMSFFGHSQITNGITNNWRKNIFGVSFKMEAIGMRCWSVILHDKLPQHIAFLWLWACRVQCTDLMAQPNTLEIF